MTDASDRARRMIRFAHGASQGGYLNCNDCHTRAYLVRHRLFDSAVQRLRRHTRGARQADLLQSIPAVGESGDHSVQ